MYSKWPAIIGIRCCWFPNHEKIIKSCEEKHHNYPQAEEPRYGKQSALEYKIFQRKDKSVTSLANKIQNPSEPDDHTEQISL